MFRLRIAVYAWTRSLAAIIFTVAAFMAGPHADAESTVLPQPVSYSDGAVAQARPECGVGEVRAVHPRARHAAP
jgi:hypothetical protein